MADLAEGTPDARYIDLFKVKYDYHNVKALLKAEAVGTAPDRMLMDMGRVSTAELQRRSAPGSWMACRRRWPRPMAEAGRFWTPPEIPSSATSCWTVLLPGYGGPGRGRPAARSYVAMWRCRLDAVNLRTASADAAHGKGADFLLGALLEGGDLAPDAVAKAASSGAAGLREPLRRHPFPRRRGAGAEA